MKKTERQRLNALREKLEAIRNACNRAEHLLVRAESENNPALIKDAESEVESL